MHKERIFICLFSSTNTFQRQLMKMHTTTPCTKKSVLMLVTALLIHTVSSHSHLECTQVQKNGTCTGFPRYYSIYKDDYKSNAESKDRNFVVSPGTLHCPLPPAGKDKEYTPNFPKARVVPGQEVTLQWPPRGHAGQPHSDVWIMCAPKRMQEGQIIQGGDPAKDDKVGEFVKVATLPYSTNCQGGDISWAKCFGSFSVPSGWDQGEYGCLWVWDLNGSQRYVDCFEFDVVSSATAYPEEQVNKNASIAGEATYPDTSVSVPTRSASARKCRVPPPTQPDSVPILEAALRKAPSPTSTAPSDNSCEALKQEMCAQTPSDDLGKHVCDHLSQEGCQKDQVCTHLVQTMCLTGRETGKCSQIKTACGSH